MALSLGSRRIYEASGLAVLAVLSAGGIAYWLSGQPTPVAVKGAASLTLATFTAWSLVVYRGNKDDPALYLAPLWTVVALVCIAALASGAHTRLASDMLFAVVVIGVGHLFWSRHQPERSVRDPYVDESFVIGPKEAHEYALGAMRRLEGVRPWVVASDPRWRKGRSRDGRREHTLPEDFELVLGHRGRWIKFDLYKGDREALPAIYALDLTRPELWGHRLRWDEEAKTWLPARHRTSSDEDPE